MTLGRDHSEQVSESGRNLSVLTTNNATMFWVCCGGKIPAYCPVDGTYIVGLTVQCEDAGCGHNKCSQCAVFPAPVERSFSI